MKEIRDIIQSCETAVQTGKKCALATVVHVEGSSYRRPGARMLITEDGQLTGAISGGCLEGDALRKALHVMTAQRTMLATYDTMDEDDGTLGLGLGCNGIIQVLIEPILPEDPLHPVALLKMAHARRQQSIVVTLFTTEDRKKPQPGTCIFQSQDGSMAGSAPNPDLDSLLKDDIAHALQAQSSSWLTCPAGEGEMTAFIEFIPPVIKLVVAGAGNDVMPLVDMADLLGWETIVVDGRANYARPDRFMKACQVLLAKPEQVLEHIAVDDWTVFALMTHNYNYDKAMLLELCRKSARHIAMLGPRKKLERILGEYRDEGVELTQENMEAIYGPAGLDIGAETSEEIALSILAEIKAVLQEKKGGPLREKSEPIHAREGLKILERGV
ncbi:MAG: XdhC family protein [Lewinellaceae bacterium]|nr:XdhC family protein [Lewinellaceae bacterium]